MLVSSACGTVEPFSSREKVRGEVAGKTRMHLETLLGIYLLRAACGAEHLVCVTSFILPTTLVGVDVFSPILQTEKLSFQRGSDLSKVSVLSQWKSLCWNLSQ